MWNHPWVLKLDEDRQLERAERAAMYGLSDSEPEDCEDETLGGFIVDSDVSSNASSIKTRAKVRYTMFSAHALCEWAWSHIHVHDDLYPVCSIQHYSP